MTTTFSGRVRSRTPIAHRRAFLLLGLLASACSGAGSGSQSSGGGDWYYHWNCNGDSECLATNPTGQPIGTVNEGPSYSMCSPLLEFAARFWGPAAWNACDQSASFPAVVMSITVSPENASLATGLTQQYTATGHYADGSSRDITGQVTWGVVTNSGSGVASVTAGGLLTALAQGTATISATQGPMSRSTSLTVGPVAIASIVVAPANPTIAKGQTQAFTATANWSDGHTTDVTGTAYWFSQSAAVATTSGAVATAQGVGSSTISASAGGNTGSTLLTVTGAALESIAVRPNAPRVAVGVPRQLTAIGTYSDHTAADVTIAAAWTSSATGVATTLAPGVVNGVASGTAVVTALIPDVSGTTTVTVTSATLLAISVEPAQPSVGPGEMLSFSAIGHFSDGTSYPIGGAGITWASSATATASIDVSGVATTAAAGTASISAAFGGVVGATTITVSASPPGSIWTWRPTGITAPPTGWGYLNSIVWTGSQLVTGGWAAAGILTSPDGLAWTYHASDPNMSAAGLAYAPELGLYVAVGNGIWTSTDAVTWTQNAAVGSVGFNAVAWSGSRFVAVGDTGIGSRTLYSSPDGFTWTSRDPGTRQALLAVTWNGAQFVAVGNATVVSADGDSWTLAPAETYSGSWVGIAWSGKKFLKVRSTYGHVATSSDGLTWTISATLPVNLYGVIWADNRFVIVGGSGGPAAVFTSTDGVNWSQGSIGVAGLVYGSTGMFRAVAWTGTRLVAVGDPVYPVNPSDGGYFIETSP